jgi:hypothetical protein
LVHLIRVALIVELGKLGEMVTENQLKSIGAPLGIWFLCARQKGRWRCFLHAEEYLWTLADTCW